MYNNEKKCFIIKPKNKKSIIETIIISNNINGKYIEIYKNIVWRGGSFNVLIPYSQVDNFLQSNIDNNKFELWMYDYELNELYDGCYVDYEIYGTEDEFLQNALLELVEDKGIDFLEDELGWQLEENEYIIINGIKIE